MRLASMCAAGASTRVEMPHNPRFRNSLESLKPLSRPIRIDEKVFWAPMWLWWYHKSGSQKKHLAFHTPWFVRVAFENYLTEIDNVLWTTRIHWGSHETSIGISLSIKGKRRKSATHWVILWMILIDIVIESGQSQWVEVSERGIPADAQLCSRSAVPQNPPEWGIPQICT